MLFGQEKASFLSTPTPWERRPRISEELGLDFYIKRDDLTNLGAVNIRLRSLLAAMDARTADAPADV